MSGLLRFAEFVVVVAFLATIIRYAILTVREPSARSRYAAALRQPDRSAAVETRLEGWRRDTGRKLWLNLVGIPLLLIGVLIVVGEYGS